MKASEFRKLIREEVKNTLNEATYPITVAELFAVGNDLIVTIGNSLVDMSGYTPSPEDKKAIDDIMIKYTAKPIRSKPSSKKFSPLQYRFPEGSMAMNGLVRMRKEIEALNLTYTNR